MGEGAYCFGRAFTAHLIKNTLKNISKGIVNSSKAIKEYSDDVEEANARHPGSKFNDKLIASYQK